jgi:hypothetical protein
MATFFGTDGTVEERKPATGDSFTLEELQAVVGGFIEVVSPIGKNIGKILVINEEGKLMELPLNENATRAMGGNLFPGDYISGNAILCTSEEMGD